MNLSRRKEELGRNTSDWDAGAGGMGWWRDERALSELKKAEKERMRTFFYAKYLD